MAIIRYLKRGRKNILNRDVVNRNYYHEDGDRSQNKSGQEPVIPDHPSHVNNFKTLFARQTATGASWHSETVVP